MLSGSGCPLWRALVCPSEALRVPISRHSAESAGAGDDALRGLAALLLTPAVWSAIPGLQNITQDLPIAGTDQQGASGGATTINVDTALVSYLEAHQGSTKYLVAVSSANQASSIILATNKPVMALGGFSGSDPILTTSQLAALVANNTVRYFLLGERWPFWRWRRWPRRRAEQPDKLGDVELHGGFGEPGASGLYYCSGS